MARKSITAVFASRGKAEEAITQLSQIGLTDIYIKTSQGIPDFNASNIGVFPFFSVNDRNYNITTIIGSISEDRSEDADRIIKKNGGIK